MTDSKPGVFLSWWSVVSVLMGLAGLALVVVFTVGALLDWNGPLQAVIGVVAILGIAGSRIAARLSG